jgi:hypothetical protein
MSYENSYKVSIPVLPTKKVKTKKCSVCNHVNDSKFCPECGGLMKDFIEEKVLSEKAIIKELSKYTDEFNYVFNNGSGSWDFETDMKQLSKKYPTAMFQVDVVWESGLGDEPSRDYFQNGKQQTAKTKITFSKFDPKKLK